jgi:hypothetical protein
MTMGAQAKIAHQDSQEFYQEKSLLPTVKFAFMLKPDSPSHWQAMDGWLAELMPMAWGAR